MGDLDRTGPRVDDDELVPSSVSRTQQIRSPSAWRSPCANGESVSRERVTRFQTCPSATRVPIGPAAVAT